jgi:hypothetical protein
VSEGLFKKAVSFASFGGETISVIYNALRWHGPIKNIEHAREEFGKT